MDQTDYPEAIANLYDHIPPYRDRPDVPFYLESARASGGPILELGCGTGRLLIPMIRAGLSVTGLDISPNMLRVCINKIIADPTLPTPPFHLVLGDMRDFRLDSVFPLVLIPFRSFQHLVSVEEQIHCLQCVWAHLEEGGRLILDLFNPSIYRIAATEYPLEWETEPPFIMQDGRSVVRQIRVISRDLHTQVSYVEMIYEVTDRGGRTETFTHSFPMRYLFRYEAEHLLARCGFAVESVFADYTRSPYGTVDPGELIFVASKSARS